ncbi:heteromeric transposase endonuclease subunit TnsA [Brevibacillus massiliensis]|uniref:heteromeric transposase endonuclease subunit TnsA n=1 Tax=Brevibacillus massiliensis TaxID=1118054 RepID=UPI0003660A06|nr:heteromeric transposase endonuclease subunit TnsA [Brevibacillus massiliensis]
MARSSDWTEAKLKRFLSEGRGQGQRENYRPWLTVMDIPSRGRASRVFSRKCNRVVHLLTDTQLRYFYLLEWDESTVDIKEQFPLLDVETILDHLDESLLKRLKDPKTEVPHVITTTFVITAKDHQGREIQYARAIKDAAELEKKATLERLEIQRRYWESRQVNFAVVTQHEIPVQRSRNIEWVMSALNVEDYGFSISQIQAYASILQERLLSSDQSIRSILASFEREMKEEAGTGLLVFRYLIASRLIHVNMDEEIQLSATPKEIGLKIALLQGGKMGIEAVR